MAKRNVDDWLEEWVDENVHTPQYYEDKFAMSGEAEACRAAAKADGFSDQELVDAADGDLLQFLLNRQNDFTLSEVRRKVAEDD